MTDNSRLMIVEPPGAPGDLGSPVSFAGCALMRLPAFVESRGVLAVTELGVDLPFEVVRCFFLYRVPTGARRGGHSLASSSEVMVGVHGSVTVDVDDGDTCWRVVLDDPTIALHIPTGVWCEEHTFSADAVLMVLASSTYDADEFDHNRPVGESGG